MWLFENKSGHWSHPVGRAHEDSQKNISLISTNNELKIHIHMVDFQIISRSNGRNIVEPYEKLALKDVAVLGPNEAVTVAVTFAPFAGLYMFHCHNLIHEDHAMMDAFNTTEVQALGYNVSDLNFTDPMEAEWRASSYVGTDTQSILEDVLPRFAATNAYENLSAQGGPLGNTTSRGTSTPFKRLWLLLTGLLCILV